MKNDLSRLGNRLYKNHGKIDLVYVNSPLVGDGELGLRSWHYGKNEDDKYGGLDASLLFLRQIWRSQPFWGAVGVGQGASIAAMLILTLLPDGDVRESSPPQFSVFIDGESMISETERLGEELFGSSCAVRRRKHSNKLKKRYFERDRSFHLCATQADKWDSRFALKTAFIRVASF